MCGCWRHVRYVIHPCAHNFGKMNARMRVKIPMLYVVYLLQTTHLHASARPGRFPAPCHLARTPLSVLGRRPSCSNATRSAQDNRAPCNTNLVSMTAACNVCPARRAGRVCGARYACPPTTAGVAGSTTSTAHNDKWRGHVATAPKRWWYGSGTFTHTLLPTTTGRSAGCRSSAQPPPRKRDARWRRTTCTAAPTATTNLHFTNDNTVPHAQPHS